MNHKLEEPARSGPLGPRCPEFEDRLDLLATFADQICMANVLGHDPSGPSFLMIYREVNYGGGSCAVGFSKDGNSRQLGWDPPRIFGYDLPRLTEWGFNNAISSIQIPKGMFVSLFDNAGASGESRLFATDQPTLGSFNGRTSSMLVTNYPPCLVVYTEPYYNGEALCLGAGFYDTPALTIGANTISSVRLPPGWKVTLFTESGFKGNSVVIPFDMTTLLGWDNRTASLMFSPP